MILSQYLTNQQPKDQYYYNHRHKNKQQIQVTCTNQTTI
jgi:hypothetical protein